VALSEDQTKSALGRQQQDHRLLQQSALIQIKTAEVPFKIFFNVSATKQNQPLGVEGSAVT
jgi:hypothetical protein